jgi:hypothetical protein
MRIVIAMVLLVACNKKERETKAEPSIPPKVVDAMAPSIDAPPKPTLEVTVGGKPVVMQSAIAIDNKNGELTILLTSWPHTCADEFGVDKHTSSPDDVDLKLRVGKFLHPDGKVGLAIRGLYTHRIGVKGTVTTQSEAQSGGDPIEETIDANARVTVALDITTDRAPVDDKPREDMRVKGTVEITGCVENAQAKEEPPPAPIGGTIEIAGQKLPIGGAAIMKTPDGVELEVSTHEVKCETEHPTSRGDVRVELQWSKAGKLQNQVLEGAWVPFANEQKALTLTATPNKPSGKSIKIALGGSSTIGGYPVALSGTVPAIVCPPAK